MEGLITPEPSERVKLKAEAEIYSSLLQIIFCLRDRNHVKLHNGNLALKQDGTCFLFSESAITITQPRPNACLDGLVSPLCLVCCCFRFRLRFRFHPAGCRGQLIRFHGIITYPGLPGLQLMKSLFFFLTDAASSKESMSDAEAEERVRMGAL